MTRVLCFCVVLVVCLLGLQSAEGARILGMFPHPGKSHFDVFQPLMEALAEKGHEVTVVSFFPHQSPPPRYQDISLVGLAAPLLNVVEFGQFESPPPAWLFPYLQFYDLSFMGQATCTAVLPSTQVKDLLQARGKYDLAIIEQFNTECFYPIVHKLEVPIIGISSCTALPWTNQRFANPTNAAFFPNVFMGLSDRMDVWERFQNTVFNMVTSALYYPLYDKPAQDLVHKYIGDSPPLQEIGKNTSLLLINTHFSLNQPKPLFPGLVEIGGIHIQPAKPLPQDLEDFIAGAEHGVVLFSLGSMLNAGTLGPDKLAAFLAVFRTLPQRVVWKLTGTLPDLPPNVRTFPWLPQRDILAHPNVKAFIAHGGLLGLTEAVHAGKPVVAIPMFGDQHTNVRAAVQAGNAVPLLYTEITEANVRQAVQTVLTDRYQQRAVELSATFRDRPIPPRDLAVYWVEYVLRNGGSPLRSAAADLTVIQYHLLDVIAVLFIAAAAVIFTIKFTISTVYKTLRTKKLKVQ